MSGCLDRKVAIVTGAGQGIGRAYAHAFAAEGASVVVNDLPGGDRSAAEIVVDEIRSAGGTAHASNETVAEFDAAARIVTTAVQEFGGLDILAANAGILRSSLLHEATESDWADVLAVNVNGTFNCIRHAAAPMIAGGGGTIITTGDITTRLYFPRVASYRAAKAAIVVLTVHAAHEFAPFGINVNSIMAGAVDTEMAASFRAGLGSELDSWLDDVGALRPEKPTERDQKAPPESVPPLGVYLCSDAGRAITGHSFQLDGDAIGVVSTDANMTFISPTADGWTPAELADRVPDWLDGVQPIG